MSNKEKLKEAIRKLQGADKETVESLDGIHKTVAELVRN